MCNNKLKLLLNQLPKDKVVDFCFVFFPSVVLSGLTSFEEKKALRDTAGSDRWDLVDHRVPEGGARER